jgi:hypothetical protein
MSDEKASDAIDRIVLRKAENDLLQGWVNALNVHFDGMIRVTKSDIANFLIRRHEPALSDDEVQAIQAEFYDETRWLNWAIAKLRQAKKDGVPLTLDDLMARRDAALHKRAASSKKVRTRALKAKDGTSGEAPPNFLQLPEE